MSPLSNAEKQARHRQKEELQRFAEQCFREAQMGAFRHGANAPAMLAQIKQMADLPSGWTKEDYEMAVERIQQLRMDLINPNNDLDNDVHDALDSFNEWQKAPTKVRIDTEKAIQETRNLASHLISAVELTNLSNGERAAALVEALRHVGRSLANERPLRRSDANTVCLATLPPQYRRPAWFAESFAKYMAFRLGTEEAKDDLGQKIMDYDFGI
ncbi:hypothetical protein [Ruegeria sp. A3M17]|uniref:hypothetical protein n=1 Tax=Ruegeria sp. A3M17 TaxID=2267229 RepID=UPI000DEBD6F3|nr:hypothetical protein [Ruegeria sp. A3M17]RBW53449.1 hypothetical protein DS906_18530 [Ruegeria sp. A3M17]